MASKRACSCPVRSCGVTRRVSAGRAVVQLGQGDDLGADLGQLPTSDDAHRQVALAETLGVDPVVHTGVVVDHHHSHAAVGVDRRSARRVAHWPIQVVHAVPERAHVGQHPELSSSANSTINASSGPRRHGMVTMRRPRRASRCSAVPAKRAPGNTLGSRLAEQRADLQLAVRPVRHRPGEEVAGPLHRRNEILRCRHRTGLIHVDSLDAELRRAFSPGVEALPHEELARTRGGRQPIRFSPCTTDVEDEAAIGLGNQIVAGDVRLGGVAEGLMQVGMIGAVVHVLLGSGPLDGEVYETRRAAVARDPVRRGTVDPRLQIDEVGVVAAELAVSARRTGGSSDSGCPWSPGRDRRLARGSASGSGRRRRAAGHPRARCP